MSYDFIKVYDAMNGFEAELIRDRLQEEGIAVMVDEMAGPLDGLTAMGQGTAIRVEVEHAERATAIIEALAAEARERGATFDADDESEPGDDAQEPDDA